MPSMESRQHRSQICPVMSMDDDQQEHMFREGFFYGIIYAVDEIKHQMDLEHDLEITLENIMLKLSDEIIRDKFNAAPRLQ